MCCTNASIYVAGVSQVGSVEQFQGQERKVIILSLVRSTTADSSKGQARKGKDLVSVLGFVSDPKRFNVAITRSRALLIVLGNARVLSLDAHWKSFIEYCVQCGAHENMTAAVKK